MPQVDLSTLSGPELRRLLDATRERGQAAQSYQILQEMAERRQRADRGGRRPLFAQRRASGGARIIAVDLGDPLEPRDEFLEAGPPQEPEAETAAPLDLRLERPPRAPPRRLGWVAAGFVGGAGLGLAVGWWLGADPQAPPPSPETPAVLAAANADDRLQLDLASGPPAPMAPDVAAAPPVTGAEADEPPPPAIADPAVEEGAAPAPAQDEAAAPDEEPRAAEAAAPDACEDAPTPADRTICADPDLRRLQRELRQAYAEALEAHAERALLRQRQLAWADARNTIDDPQRLAELYRERIRRLNAATADARRQQQAR